MNFENYFTEQYFEAYNTASNMENEVVLQRRIELPESGKEAIVVSINRPGRLNCFNTKVVLLLAKIFSDIALEVEKAEHDIAAVIFTGALYLIILQQLI